MRRYFFSICATEKSTELSFLRHMISFDSKVYMIEQKKCGKEKKTFWNWKTIAFWRSPDGKSVVSHSFCFRLQREKLFHFKIIINFSFLFQRVMVPKIALNESSQNKYEYFHNQEQITKLKFSLDNQNTFHPRT